MHTQAIYCLHIATSGLPLPIPPTMLGKDGKPMNDLFVKDGLHLSAKGYHLWSKHVHQWIHDQKS